MFPQGLEPCCFPLPEGRLGFSFLYVAPCIPGDTESTSTGLLRRQRCRPCSLCPHQPAWAEPALSLLPACHTGLPLPCHSCPQIPGDVALALPSLRLMPCSHQLPQGAVLLQRLRDFLGALGSDGVFLQAAKVRKAPVNARCHIPIGAIALCWVAGGGTADPGHSLQGHQPVVGQQGLSQIGGPILLDGVVLEAVGDRSEARHGCFHSRARGSAGLQGSGHLPWGLLALVPG